MDELSEHIDTTELTPDASELPDELIQISNKIFCLLQRLSITSLTYSPYSVILRSFLRNIVQAREAYL